MPRKSGTTNTRRPKAATEAEARGSRGRKPAARAAPRVDPWAAYYVAAMSALRAPPRRRRT